MMNKFLILLVCFIASEISFSQSGREIEITTELKETFLDKSGKPLTGKGVVIGDVDSGIDIFHPMFFFADGGEFDWIDTDNDDVFTPGGDGVDLNKNGISDASETLGYIEIKNNTYDIVKTDQKHFNTEFDFLYADKNGNKRRDFGVKDGFKETDPTYGEQLFIALDKNKNGKLDKGEKLAALKTSKVRAIRERNGTVRRRGTDLIYAEEDSSGHGTGVSGLLLGGQYGVQKIHGLAPDAEIIVTDIEYAYTPRFVRNFPDLIKFLKDEKVNIILIEDGEWVWETMDGSTEEEEILNQCAREGITIVGGAGNLATGRMHLKDTIDGGESKTYTLECPELHAEGKLNNGVYASFLWRNPAEKLSFVIETPDKQTTSELSSNSDFIKAGKYNIVYSREVSPKGTAIFRLGFSRADSGSVEGRWKIKVKPAAKTIIEGYTVDVSQSWSGSSHWTSHLTDETTVTFPATCDSCIAVGAYVVNFGWFDRVGDLATYSGRGFNVTGKMGVDITGPGHTTITTEKNFGWMTFSGTSSAAPHVAGVAALMLGYNPLLTHTQIREILLKTAAKDNFTGEVPNTDWGYGKLNKEGALRFLIDNY